MLRETTPLNLKKERGNSKDLLLQKIQLILSYTNEESLILTQLSLFETTFFLVKLGYYLTSTRSSKNKKTMIRKHMSDWE